MLTEIACVLVIPVCLWEVFHVSIILVHVYVWLMMRCKIPVCKLCYMCHSWMSLRCSITFLYNNTYIVCDYRVWISEMHCLLFLYDWSILPYYTCVWRGCFVLIICLYYFVITECLIYIVQFLCPIYVSSRVS